MEIELKFMQNPILSKTLIIMFELFYSKKSHRIHKLYSYIIFYMIFISLIYRKMKLNDIEIK